YITLVFEPHNTHLSSCGWQNPAAPTKELGMQQDIHPDYHYVIFNDLASGERVLTRTTATSERTAEWDDGNTYPVIDVEISAASHPFYTGKQRILDTARRVERFNARFKSFGAKKQITILLSYLKPPHTISCDTLFFNHVAPNPAQNQ